MKAHPDQTQAPASAARTAPFFQRKATEGFFSKAPALQRKPVLGKPNDAFEQEADRVADAVVSANPATSTATESTSLQRKCDGCENEEVQTKLNSSENIQRKGEEEEEMLQAKPLAINERVQRQPEEEEEPIQAESDGTNPTTVSSDFASQLSSTSGNGAQLPTSIQAKMGKQMGADFSNVRIHTNSQAAEMSQSIQAKAFTHGSDIYFNKGQYNPETKSGQHLLAHELTHTVQQGASSVRRKPIDTLSRVGRSAIQRAVAYDVTSFTATKIGPPTIRNGTDQRMMRIPPSGQIRMKAKIMVNGGAADNCSGHAFGTTQTAWVAWTRIRYRGRTAADGSVTLSHRPPMPMRDPADTSSVWYDATKVVNPATCGSEIEVTHFDSPWHEFPKATNNTAVTGSPLNYLRSYERGLHLVTYLTVQEPSGAFNTRPLKYRYWNTQQRYDFTPQFPSPPGNAAFLSLWPSSGGITVNVGSSGSGEVADAPHYETVGTEYNTHFNNSGNWTRAESA